MLNSDVMYFFVDELQKEGGAVGNAGKWLKKELAYGAKETVRRGGAFVRDPVKATVEGAKESWRTSGVLGRTMIHGGTAAAAGLDLHTKNDPVTGRPLGAGERIGRAVGGASTSLATAPAGVIAGMVVGGAGGAVGARAGRLVDKGVDRLRGKHE